MLPVPAHRSDIIRILPASEVSSLHFEKRMPDGSIRNSTDFDIRIEKIRL